MFDPDRYYKPQDEEMRQIATVGTLAQWRYSGTSGPSYIKIGSSGRVIYRGSDLVEWLDKNRVTPRTD